MDETPNPGETPPGLKFLKLLVTILTGTMIAGLLAVIWLLVIRLPAAMDQGRGADLVLPASLSLPEGAKASAVTFGPDWIAVVSGSDEILIYDRTSGALRQRVELTP